MTAESGAGGPLARNIGVGCFTAVAGWFSGAMFAVLVAKLVGVARGCAAAENGAPCDWYVYAIVGAVIGAITLPALALWRLRQSDAAARNSQ